MNTRMWIMETDQYGMTGYKFCVDNPVIVPRVGEFIDADDASGHVISVQYYYRTEEQQIKRQAQFGLVVYVYLSKEKP